MCLVKPLLEISAAFFPTWPPILSCARCNTNTGQGASLSNALTVRLSKTCAPMVSRLRRRTTIAFALVLQASSTSASATVRPLRVAVRTATPTALATASARRRMRVDASSASGKHTSRGALIGTVRMWTIRKSTFLGSNIPENLQTVRMASSSSGRPCVPKRTRGVSRCFKLICPLLEVCHQTCSRRAQGSARNHQELHKVSGGQIPAPGQVAEVIAHAIATDRPRLRSLVGANAEALVRGRSGVRRRGDRERAADERCRLHRDDAAPLRYRPLLTALSRLETRRAVALGAVSTTGRGSRFRPGSHDRPNQEVKGGEAAVSAPEKAWIS
jgi:hypothetical protein